MEKEMVWEEGVAMLVPELQAGDTQGSSWFGSSLPSWAEG